jgi:hypothetical protein
MSGVGPVAIDQGLSVAFSKWKGPSRASSPGTMELGLCPIIAKHRLTRILESAHGESMAQNVQGAHKACLTSHMDEKRP